MILRSLFERVPISDSDEVVCYDLDTGSSFDDLMHFSLEYFRGRGNFKGNAPPTAATTVHLKRR